jgi:hypothetical protein
VVEKSWWNLSSCSSLRFGRKKSKWECKNESSMSYYTLLTVILLKVLKKFLAVSKEI